MCGTVKGYLGIPVNSDSMATHVSSYPGQLVPISTHAEMNRYGCQHLYMFLSYMSTCTQKLGMWPKLAGYDNDSYAEHKRKLTSIVTLEWIIHMY